MWARGSLLRQIFELRSIGASVTFFVITGLIFLVVSLQLSQSQQADWVVILSSILREISTIFIISGLWTGISEWLLKKSFIKIFEDITRELREEIIQKIDDDYKGLNKKMEDDYKILNKKMDDDYTSVASLIDEREKRLSDELTTRIIGKIEDSTNLLKDRLNLVEQIDNLGLVKIYEDANRIEINEIILEAKQLIILLNDGRTWISNNEPRMAQRFSDPNKETTFYLLHPDSDAIKVIARKEDTTVEEVKAKLNQTISILRRIRSSNTKLKVYGHFLSNPYSLYMTEKCAVHVPFMSSTKEILPAFKFENRGGNCQYDKIKRDLENLVLQNKAQEIVDYKFKSDA